MRYIYNFDILTEVFSYTRAVEYLPYSTFYNALIVCLLTEKPYHSLRAQRGLIRCERGFKSPFTVDFLFSIEYIKQFITSWYMAGHFTRVLYFLSPSAHENIQYTVKYLTIFHSDSLWPYGEHEYLAIMIVTRMIKPFSNAH